MLRGLGRDDAERHRAAEAERVADRHHPVADAHRRGGAELHRLQRLLGGVTFRSAMSVLVSLPISSRLELGAVVQVDLDLLGAVDHVVVGDDDAFLAVDDEAGAERGDHAVLRRSAAAVIEEIVEVLVIGRALRHARAAAAPCGPLIAWLVETLTTASINSRQRARPTAGPRVCALHRPASSASRKQTPRTAAGPARAVAPPPRAECLPCSAQSPAGTFLSRPTAQAVSSCGGGRCMHCKWMAMRRPVNATRSLSPR